MSNKLSDCQRFRAGYPDCLKYKGSKNLKFYSNQICSVPDGDFIDNIHTKWAKKYQLLEKHHGYIQWLFPIREPGLNNESQPLTDDEREVMRKDPEICERFLKSFQMMLDFYGMELERSTNEIYRAENWQERFENLRTHPHNNLRLSRIIKCLHEFNFGYLQAPFVKFLAHEVWGSKALYTPRLSDSMKNFYVNLVVDEEDRLSLLLFIKETYKIVCKEPSDVLPKTVSLRIKSMNTETSLTYCRSESEKDNIISENIKKALIEDIEDSHVESGNILREKRESCELSDSDKKRSKTSD